MKNIILKLRNFTRKIKQEISKRIKLSDQDINKIITENKIAENSYQKQYDKDTFHSYIYGEQIKYQKEIDSMLSVLNIYKNPKVKISEKN
ncbi:hypothetical protein JCM19297_1671 [Nonlabens ulvanivorans]|nr:hypothetical protein [Nonlabens ulvanivorans]GAK91719.1 hypothetical protein JCM19297_1671 [Nonlabens ulvanivorans]